MRRLAFAFAAGAMSTAACSLGLSESMVRGDSTSGQGGAGTGNPTSVGGGGGSPLTTGSSTTGGLLCGNTVCDHAIEDCSTCPQDCPCFTGTGCKGGKCMDCPATFKVDVDPPDALATSGLAAFNGKLYLAPTLPSGGGSNTALVEVDACFGEAFSTTVHAPMSDDSVGGPIALGGIGADVVAACGFSPTSADHGAALVFGGNDGPDVPWQVRANTSPGNDALFGIAAAKSVWMATGARAASPAGWVVYGDLEGQKICTKNDPFTGDLATGAAAATDGVRLYVAGNDASTSSVSIVVFDANTCDPSSCSCAEVKHFDAIAIGDQMTEVAAMLFAAGQLYLAGFASNDGVAFYAFVASISTADGTVGPVYTNDATGSLDAFVSLAFDGTLVYAGGYEGASQVGDVSDATGVVVGLPAALGSPTFTVHPGNARSIVGLAVDPSQPGVFFAHVDKSPGAAVFRCKSSGAACP